MILLESLNLNLPCTYFDLRKLTLGFAVVILFTTQCNAQEKTPRKEFLIKLSKHNIFLAPGEKDSVEVKIIRSGFFKDSPIQLSIGGKIPKGITADLTPPTEKEPGKIIFTANSDMLDSDCNLIVQGQTLNTRIISKGSVLKLSSGTKQTKKY